MSFNQSRSDKSETQYKKSGRSATSNQQRPSSSGYGRGAGPSPSSPSSSFLPSNRSFKKSNNAQGGQSRVSVPVSNSSDSTNASAPRNVSNGAHVQPPLHGASDAPVVAAVAKPTEAPATQRSTRAVPKAPTSQSTPLSSDSVSPATPAKDSSKAFPFQFGTISPGFMNGMQVPARTSSAPPNLDEQKRDQVLHHSFRNAPPVPSPTPKQQLPGKDASAGDRNTTGEVHPVPKAKKETQVSPAPPVSQTQKPSVLPMPMPSMQIPYHQPQVPMQFGGPNPPMQAQGVTATSLQMPLPMPLPMGNAPQVQQPVFVQGLQPHPMQPQGIMHQGQSLGFTAQMSPQIPPQLGNLGIGMASQYPQQQGGKFGSQRKPTLVKITDPKTHEELRLDKRTDAYADSGTGLRSHPSIPQSQPIASFGASHPINYYGNSYGANGVFFPTPSSVPLTGSQIAPNSQPTRYNYSVNQGPQSVSFMNSSPLNSTPLNKSGTAIHGVADSTNTEHARDVHTVISSAPSGSVHVTIKQAASPSVERIADSSSSSSSSTFEKGGFHKSSRSIVEAGSYHPRRDSETCSMSSLQQPKFGSESLETSSLQMAAKQPSVIGVELPQSDPSFVSAQSEDSAPVVVNAEGRKRENLSRSNSIKDHQKKPSKKGYVQPQHQAGGKPASVSSPSPCNSELSSSPHSGASETVQSAATLSNTSDANKESTPTTGAVISKLCEAKVNNSSGDGISAVSSQISDTGVVFDTLDVPHDKSDDSSLQLKCDTSGIEKQGMGTEPEDSRQGNISVEISSEHTSSNSVDLRKKSEEESAVTSVASGNEVPAVENLQQARLDEPVTCHSGNERMSDNIDSSKMRCMDSIGTESSHCNSTLALDASSGKTENESVKVVSSAKAGVPECHMPPSLTQDLSGGALKHEEGVENTGAVSVSVEISSSKDKPVELTKPRSSTGSAKKKKREICQKADAAGTTSDLYMAYKGPEEKKEIDASSNIPEHTSTSSSLKQASGDTSQMDSVINEKGVQNKAEPENWEDAADISTPKLETSDKKEQPHRGQVLPGDDENANTAKKYSRDFLLKFSEQCTDLPAGFEVTSDIAETLMGWSIHAVDRDSYPSPGRVMERTNSGPRVDRRGSVVVEDDRWNKPQGAFGPGRDLRMDIGYGGNIGFRPGPGGNYGVLRNPRGQTPLQGGILSGPMQSIVPQGMMHRNNPDAERWERPTSFQRGLIPSPQTPLQMMHRAERKYEVGKVTDEEQAKQRRLKAILNKLTPQNFEKLFEQVKAVNIDNTVTLTGVISQIFDKALMEPTFCEMYANFCYYLAGELPDFSSENKKITFKRLLLNKCQEEFERGEREQEEANKVEEGEIKQSEEEREEKRIKARRRMLGNIRLIGELYKKRMLTERIMHECIKKLLGQYQNPDEEDVEALCKLMSTIGEMIDHSKAKEHMDGYFDMMAKLSNNMKLSSRVRFMLKDSIDLRKNKWQQRRKVEGPKKIEEVHRDAAQERQQQTSRLSRNQSTNPSTRRAPMDFSQRGSALSSPGSHMGSFRGLPGQGRGFGNQDFRFEERQPYEARTLSVPLPPRSLGEDITLIPQGGLAKGMSIRGSPTVADVPPNVGDSRRMAPSNGFGTISERPTYSPRDLTPRNDPDRYSVPTAYNQLSPQERNKNYINRDVRSVDHGFDRPIATSPPARVVGPATTHSAPSEKVWPEERMRHMSMSTIREYYSSRDEKEIELCVKDLNSPGFHPSMISLWVNDSFERKDMERDLLAKLLVNLTRSPDSILTASQLMKGFEYVLTTLEDAVNDAPKAAEFLGRVFAEVVLENVVSLGEIGKLLREGGEEPGRLLEIGLAGDVLGSTLERVKIEKGEEVLNEIRAGSNLPLRDFRPPDTTYRSRILENFI